MKIVAYIVIAIVCFFGWGVIGHLTGMQDKAIAVSILASTSMFCFIANEFYFKPKQEKKDGGEG